MGELPLAGSEFEAVISLYDRERHHPLVFRYSGVDIGVAGLSYLAVTLWHLGYPDQALQRVNEGLTLAEELSHPFSLQFAQFFVGIVRQYRREAPATQESAARLIALSAEHGFTPQLAHATVQSGWSMAKQGRHEEGIPEIHKGLRALHATRMDLGHPYFLSMLIDACNEAGCFAEAASGIAEALALADQHEDRTSEADIHRLKGELLLRRNESNAPEAQSCFERAIEIARGQSAKSYELRATTSLARLLGKQGRRDEARTMLAEIYKWFTEGFDTADLKDAKALLDDLRS
jgi:predicted ATPase